MIVAGSVLALLLMGLAVDGFVNPADEEPDDEADDQDDGLHADDQSGAGSGLLDILNANEDSAEDPAERSASPEAFSYTPIDQIEPDDEDNAFEQAEVQADQAWEDTASGEPEDNFVDIYDTMEIGDGQDVPYVATFDPETDTLVLEFIGVDADAPEIDVAYDPDEDATIVLANGVPVTMVEANDDMTTDHVRVVMGEDDVSTEPPTQADAKADETELVAPLVQPDAENFEKRNEMPSDPEPQVLVTDNEATPIDAEMPKTSDPASLGPQAQALDPLLADPSVLSEAADDEDQPEGSTIHEVDDDTHDGDISTQDDEGETRTAEPDIDNIFDGDGDDAVTGSDDDETLAGHDGEDTLMAGDGYDQVHGGGGDDEMHGEDGDDTLDGGDDRDLIFGGAGSDMLVGGDGADVLQGGLGDDTLHGGAGDDTLDGGGGDGVSSTNLLLGGDGNDQIILGQDDMAYGGAGADTFSGGSYVETAEVAGHVADFNPSEDRIEVIFDPDESPDPRLEVLDFADGSGADIILNGQVILSVSGAQGLDPNMIDLQARA